MIPSDGVQDQDPSKPAMAFKKMRMTLACVRCRSKKVRCDYAHPSCKRCSHAKAPCSYEGSSTQVDLFNIVKLNDIVGALQQRVQSLESTLNDIHQTTQTVTDHLDGKGPAEMIPATLNNHDTTTVQSSTTLNGKVSNQHQWSLSLCPTGLRIDTNIVSPPNLYDILLSGISQLDLDEEPTMTDEAVDDSLSPIIKSPMCLSQSSSHIPQQTSQHKQHQQLPIMVARKTPLWRSKFATFPLYSTWSSLKDQASPSINQPCTNDSHHHRYHHNITAPSVLDTMIEIYKECFLCLPETGYEGTIDERYHQGTLDPLLANAIFAWSARHGAIYHDLFTGQDPNEVGENYFATAKDLLKDRFMIPTMDTLHGLLVLYVYATGRPSKSSNQESEEQARSRNNTMESEAYIFLGLAIRMCLDLKLHEENDKSGCSNLMQDSSNKWMIQERYRRFFWVLYFLETLCSLHSDRPFSLPSEDQMMVAYPDMLGDEQGERRWRTEFMMKRFRITRIYRDIIQRTAHERLLLSSISELDASLCEWYQQLPSHLQYNQGDYLQRRWISTSFREQACLKLNFEYQFQRCQLYAVFLKRQQDNGIRSTGDGIDDHDNARDNGDTQGNIASTTIELKAKEVCLTATTMTIELMQCWNQLQQRWCHFSLDPLMMAVNIFEVLVKDKGYVEQVQVRLATMLDILQKSPIQHHRYVVLLMARIRQLAPSTRKMDEDTLIKTADLQLTKAVLENRDEKYEQPHHEDIQTHYDQQPCHYQHQLPYALSYQQPVDFYNGLRYQKLDGRMDMDFCDLPFSDFLYNPVMEISTHIGFTALNSIEAPAHASEFCLMEPRMTPTTLALSVSTPRTSVSAETTAPSPPSKRISPTLTAYPHELESSSRFPTSESPPLWKTLHQPTYAPNGLVDFEYVPSQTTDPANVHHYHPTS